MLLEIGLWGNLTFARGAVDPSRLRTILELMEADALREELEMELSAALVIDKMHSPGKKDHSGKVDLTRAEWERTEAWRRQLSYTEVAMVSMARVLVTDPH